MYSLDLFALQPLPPPVAVAAPGQTVVVTGPATYTPPPVVVARPPARTSTVVVTPQPAARTNVVVRERVVVQERVRFVIFYQGL